MGRESEEVTIGFNCYAIANLLTDARVSPRDKDSILGCLVKSKLSSYVSGVNNCTKCTRSFSDAQRRDVLDRYDKLLSAARTFEDNPSYMSRVTVQVELKAFGRAVYPAIEKLLTPSASK